jgi:hypothetical protein
MNIKECAKCKIEKPINEFNKDRKRKDSLYIYCRSCKSIIGKEYRNNFSYEQKEKERERMRKYEENHREKRRLKNKKFREKDKKEQSLRAIAWQKKNKEKDQETKKLWRLNNPEKIKELRNKWNNNNKEKCKEMSRRYRENNPDKCLALSNEKRARKAGATPGWANKEKITDIYKEARRLSKITGILFHVDHIIPLRHKLVCGLHVHTNLQILTASENLKKHNTYII